MKITQQPSTQFRGIQLKEISIKKNPSLEKIKVNIIKYENRDSNAIKALDWIWPNNLYLSTIAFMLSCNFTSCTTPEALYITTQKDNFEKIDPDNLSTIVEFHKTNKNEIRINYLESKQSYPFLNFVSEYKGGASEIVKCLQEMYEKITLHAANKSLIPFYKKLGFISDEKQPQEMYWKKQNSIT